jgi:hypothetical protein
MDGNLERGAKTVEKGEKVSADRCETFSDLENVRNAIRAEDERSRQQRCKCNWDYATFNGTQRAHNPLCPVHDSEPVVDASAMTRAIQARLANAAPKEPHAA